MTVERTNDYLLSLLNELRNLPQETEWVEFKHNNAEYVQCNFMTTTLRERFGIDTKNRVALPYLLTL